MKKLIIFLLLFGFIIPLSFGISIDCHKCCGNKHSCITDCQTGLLDIFKDECKSELVYEVSIFNGNAEWYSGEAKNYYLKIFCDDGRISECIPVNIEITTVSNLTTTTTQTTSTIVSTIISQTTTTTLVQHSNETNLFSKLFTLIFSFVKIFGF